MKRLGPILFSGIIGITSYLYFNVSLISPDSNIYQEFSEFNPDSTIFPAGDTAFGFPDYRDENLDDLNPFRNSISTPVPKDKVRENPEINRGTYRLKGLSELKTAIIEIPGGQTVVAEPGDEFGSVTLISIGESFILLQDKHGRFKIELGEN